MNILKEFSETNHFEVADIQEFFGLSMQNARNYLKAGSLSRTQFKRILTSFEQKIRKEEQVKSQNEFLEHVQEFHSIKSDTDLAKLLKYAQSFVPQFRKKQMKERARYTLFKKTMNATSEKILAPIIEFYEIASESNILLGLHSESRYADGLVSRLKESKGIYVFFDSRGQTLYIGKAQSQSLWTRMQTSYKNSAKELDLFAVTHPRNDVPYRPGNEVTNRRLTNRKQDLLSAAKYFSAYEVTIPSFIPVLEALLIRCFPNNIANKKMENFPRLRN